MYQKHSKCFCLLLLLFACITSMAQQKTVTGKITDQASNLPLVGADITVKGTISTVMSDAEGKFTIGVPSNESVLVITHIGYGEQEITVGARTNLSIVMSNIQKSMDEVVVIGYGTIKRRDLTGSVASLKGSEIVQTPTFNAVEAMQGRVTGVDITRSSGVAGAGSNIRVRGNRSINGSNEPLFIIDGFQGGNLSDLNPNDIA